MGPHSSGRDRGVAAGQYDGDRGRRGSAGGRRGVPAVHRASGHRRDPEADAEARPLPPEHALALRPQHRQRRLPGRLPRDRDRRPRRDAPAHARQQRGLRPAASPRRSPSSGSGSPAGSPTRARPSLPAIARSSRRTSPSASSSSASSRRSGSSHPRSSSIASSRCSSADARCSSATPAASASPEAIQLGRRSSTRSSSRPQLRA